MSATPALHSEAFGKQKARQTLRVLFSENNKIIRRFLTIWLSSAELNLIYAWDEVITADFVMIWIFVDSQSVRWPPLHESKDYCVSSVLGFISLHFQKILIYKTKSHGKKLDSPFIQVLITWNQPNSFSVWCLLTKTCSNSPDFSGNLDCLLGLVCCGPNTQTRLQGGLGEKTTWGAAVSQPVSQSVFYGIFLIYNCFARKWFPQKK